MRSTAPPPPVATLERRTARADAPRPGALTSELTISSGTLCTMDTVAVDSGACCLPFPLCSLWGEGP